MEKIYFYEKIHEIISDFIKQQKLSITLEKDKPKELGKFIEKILRNFVLLLKDKRENNIKK